MRGYYIIITIFARRRFLAGPGVYARLCVLLVGVGPVAQAPCGAFGVLLGHGARAIDRRGPELAVVGAPSQRSSGPRASGSRGPAQAIVGAPR